MSEYVAYALGAVASFTKVGVMGPYDDVTLGSPLRITGIWRVGFLLSAGGALAWFASARIFA